MWGLIKRTIKRLLSICGIGIYRIDRPPIGITNAKGVVITALQANSKEQFEEEYSSPEWRKRYFDRERMEFYDKVIDVLREKGIDCDNKHILDVGCGTGELLLHIAREFSPASMTGLDFVEAALRVAQARLPQAKFELYDLCGPRKEQAFDIVLCTEVLEHLLPAQKALKNLLALTNRSGVLVITVPNGRTDTLAEHINFWSPESWLVFLKDACGDCEVETGLIPNRRKQFAIVRPK